MNKTLNIILTIIGVIIFLFLLLAAATQYFFEEVEEPEVAPIINENKDELVFNKYLTRDDNRVIYLASNLDEFYVYDDNNNKHPLKEYAKTWQSLDDIVKHITSSLSLYGELNDGGTKIYKSEKENATIVVCHTTTGNNDIYIGDYHLEYDKQVTCQKSEVGDNVHKLKITIDNKEYQIDLENNETVTEFINILPKTITMNELNGNEKYAYLDTKFKTNAYNPKTINKGDVMLYGDNCLVIFYKTFTTSYSYTKIGHIDALPDLGNGSINVTIVK